MGVAPLLTDLDFAALLADKAFDSDGFRTELDNRGAVTMIPPKANRVTTIPCDFEMYKWRHLVENFFCKIKEFRRIATRYDKTDTSFAAMISSSDQSSRVVLSAFTQHYDLRHKCQSGFDDFQSGPGKQFRQILPYIVGIVGLMEAKGKQLKQPVEFRLVTLLYRFHENQDAIVFQHPRHLGRRRRPDFAGQLVEQVDTGHRIEAAIGAGMRSAGACTTWARDQGASKRRACPR